jgi:hypothetical protein
MACVLFCLSMGWGGGFIIAYILSKTESRFIFSYEPSIVYGIVFGFGGLIYLIRELWLR